MLKVTRKTLRCAPSSALTVEVRWAQPAPPGRITARFTWRTEGKGDSDTGEGTSASVAAPTASGHAELRIVAPDGPLTFHGRLLSVLWTLELTGGGETLELPVVVAPDGTPRKLPGSK